MGTGDLNPVLWLSWDLLWRPCIQRSIFRRVQYNSRLQFFSHLSKPDLGLRLLVTNRNPPHSQIQERSPDFLSHPTPVFISWLSLLLDWWVNLENHLHAAWPTADIPSELNPGHCPDPTAPNRRRPRPRLHCTCEYPSCLPWDWHDEEAHVSTQARAWWNRDAQDAAHRRWRDDQLPAYWRWLISSAQVALGVICVPEDQNSKSNGFVHFLIP